MRCERHGVALAPDGSCVLCRRESPPAHAPNVRGSLRPRVLILATLLIVALVGAAAVVRSPSRMDWLVQAAAPPATASQGATGLTGTMGVLTTKNSSGRSGVFFLPAGHDQRPVPVLVAIHGTGSSGRQIAGVFREAAERRGFILVAPDSRQRTDGVFTWEVGDQPGDITEDFEHVRACLAEVLAMPGVRMDPGHVLIAGHSGGASTAPYVATNTEPFTAFAVLHGGVFAGGLGRRDVRGWFSTGSVDPLRPPPGVQEAAEAVRRAGFSDVGYREFPEGHEVGAKEVEALVVWWLGGQ
jgi:poly(3-hydroxybutyrate) depolymerase